LIACIVFAFLFYYDRKAPGIKQCLDKLADVKVSEKVEKMQQGSWA
jgi:hypothetical protein